MSIIIVEDKDKTYEKNYEFERRNREIKKFYEGAKFEKINLVELYRRRTVELRIGIESSTEKAIPMNSVPLENMV
jgi:hypothetical protein